MEDNNENLVENTEPPIAKTYEIDGCTIVVRRKFENGGLGILEQVVSLLLDILEQKESEDKLAKQNNT